MTYRIHPLCAVFPTMPEQELQALADDIRRNGQKRAVLRYEGEIVDGKNRLKACEIAGVEPLFEEWSGEGSLLDFIVSENLHRRHLSPSQRAVLAVDLKPFYDKQAKGRQRLSKGRAKKGSKAADSEKGKSSAKVAEVVGANSHYVEIAEQIKKTKPKLFDQLRSGEVTVPQAKRALKPSDKSDVASPSSLCQVIHDLVSPHYKIKTLLEPCAGDGNLTKPWRGHKDVKVIAFEIKRGKDFLKHNEPIGCDLVLCNPPFSRPNGDGKESMLEPFLKHILDLVPKNTPIVFFAPSSFRLKNTPTSTRWQWLRDECPRITSIMALPSNIFRILVHPIEVLFFNMPKLEQHYFFDDRYLTAEGPAKAEVPSRRRPRKRKPTNSLPLSESTTTLA